MAALQLEREVEQFAEAKVLLDFEELNPIFLGAENFYSQLFVSPLSVDCVDIF